MLHVRDKSPDVPEEVDEVIVESEEVTEPLYERDRDTGLLLKTGESVTFLRTRQRKTGKKVRTGSMLQGDMACRDCGAEIVAAPNDRDFPYLICGRLNVRPPDDKGKPENGRWLPSRNEDNEPIWVIVEAEEPRPGSVLECGGWER